tara:strand:- start:827 stop:1048 length:222 start_codon:yes stop_codon:yes gene_type:complete
MEQKKVKVEVCELCRNAADKEYTGESCRGALREYSGTIMGYDCDWYDGEDAKHVLTEEVTFVYTNGRWVKEEE